MGDALGKRKQYMLHFLLSEGKGEIRQRYQDYIVAIPAFLLLYSTYRVTPASIGRRLVNYKTVTATYSYLPKKKRIGECVV
jgi:hypothetical protein